MTNSERMKSAISPINAQRPATKKEISKLGDMMNILFVNHQGQTFSDSCKIIDKPTGSIVVAQNDTTSAAKMEIYPSEVLYYVKYGTCGIYVGRLLNPYNTLGNARDYLAYDSHGGRAYFEYKRVSKDIYDSYVQFLKTRNPVHLLSAERGIVNG